MELEALCQIIQWSLFCPSFLLFPRGTLCEIKSKKVFEYSLDYCSGMRNVVNIADGNFQESKDVIFCFQLRANANAKIFKEVLRLKRINLEQSCGQ